MAKKGISEIIATILMLMITVGLAGTAFIYIQNSLISRTQKQIVLSDVSCASPGASATIYVTIKNLDPKFSITPASDLLVRFDQAPVAPASITWSPTPIGSNTNSVGTFTCPAGCTQGTFHDMKVIGPSNTVEGQVTC